MPTPAEVSSAASAIDLLQVPAPIAAELRREALRCYPAEACGFLIGTCDGNGRPTPGSGGTTTRRRQALVHRLRPEVNRATRSDRYLIDPADVFAAMRAARATGEEILGVYHSHPDGVARPSERDRSEAWGEWLYVIVACDARGAGAITCWRQQGDALPQVTVHEERPGGTGETSPGEHASGGAREAS